MKILFIYQGLSTFVKKDLDVLRSVHTVREFYFEGIRCIPQLFKNILWCDVTFFWFGKLHAFFGVLFSNILKKNQLLLPGGMMLQNMLLVVSPMDSLSIP